jgi:hypothetical protein
MKTTAVLSTSLEQPWWRVRVQLLVLLAALGALCAALWTDTPVRNWMSNQVIRGEFPTMTLLAAHTER